MSTLPLWLALAGFMMPAADAWQTARGQVVSAVAKTSVKGDVGYFFSLRQVPLSEKQYIFSADPLKKAVLVDGDKNIFLSHTMTVRSAKGFDMYFSAADYNVTLAVKEAKRIDEGMTEYKGTLLIRHGSEKQKFAVHGFQNR
jgi:hypothetical protein